jgi:hypothetical protein
MKNTQKVNESHCDASSNTACPPLSAGESLSGCSSAEAPNNETNGNSNDKTAPSAARVAANRRNALKSTGPTSSQGKRNSAKNSFKHGLFSRWLVVDDRTAGEDSEEFGCLLCEIEAHYNPVGLEKKLRCEELAVAIWKRRRLLRYESGQLALTLALRRAELAGVSSSAESDYDIENNPEVKAITDHLLLLSRDDLDRKARSESMITRQMNLALSELERLQALRKTGARSASFRDDRE